MSSASLVVINDEGHPVALFTHERLADAWIAAQAQPDDYQVHCDKGGEPAIFLTNPEPEAMEEPSGEYDPGIRTLSVEEMEKMQPRKCLLCDSTYRVLDNNVCEDCFSGIPG